MSTKNSKKWLQAVAHHLNLSPSQLAREAGMAASTLTRYINDGSGTVGISEKSLSAISEFSGVPIYEMPGATQSGMSEADATPFERADPVHTDKSKAAVDVFTVGADNVDAWIMRGWSLENSSVLPGDILIVDQDRRPKAGDLVCVQLSDWSTGRAETVMRLYQPPYVISNSSRIALTRPEVVDDDRVAIRGTVTSVMRIS